jgi:hypothetical protein
VKPACDDVECDGSEHGPDAALTEKVCALIREGAYVSSAAVLAGISRATHYRWMKLGAKGRPGFTEYAGAVERASAIRETRLLATIANGGDKGKAAQWLAEKMYPDRYGSRARIEHSGPDGSPIQTETVARVVVLPPLEDEPDGSSVAPEPGPANALPGVPCE